MAINGGTHFPKLEPSAKIIAETFLAEIQLLGFVGVDGQGTPSKAHLAEIATGARDYALDIGEKPDLLRATIRKMREEGLIIATPRSCKKVSRELSQWARENLQKSYHEAFARHFGEGDGERK